MLGEFLFKSLGQVERKFLSPGYDKTKAPQLVRFGFP